MTAPPAEVMSQAPAAVRPRLARRYWVVTTSGRCRMYNRIEVDSQFAGEPVGALQGLAEQSRDDLARRAITLSRCLSTCPGFFSIPPI